MTNHRRLQRQHPYHLLPTRHPTEDIIRSITDHIRDHDGYIAVSGGKDSLVALHLAHQTGHDIPAVFFDSGLEYPETYHYLEQLADHFDISIEQFPAPRTVLDIMVASNTWEHGPQHTSASGVDGITEPAADAHHRYGPGEIWGVRGDESAGRRRAYAVALRDEITRNCNNCCPPTPNGRHSAAQYRKHGGLIRRRDGTVAYGPIWNWTTRDVWAYIGRHRLPINPVYAKLRRLGAPEQALRISQMLDGGHLHLGRAVWLRRGWPALFDELAQILPRLREFT